MEDSFIIDLFYERSEQAILALSEKYGAFLTRVAENILGDKLDAEECVNDTYLAVWNAIPPARPDPLLSYVCRIARNLALKKYQANTAKKRDSRFDVALEEIAECFPAAMSVEEEIEAKETAAAVGRFLETLRKRDRILFVRRYWHADSIEDLAVLFQMSRHAVSVRLSRIRKALKTYLIREGISV